MTNAVLVLNSGASSIRFAAFDCIDAASEMNLIGKGQVSQAGADVELFVKSADCSHPEISRVRSAGGGFDHEKALARILNWMGNHRGGLKIVDVIRTDDEEMVAGRTLRGTERVWASATIHALAA